VYGRRKAHRSSLCRRASTRRIRTTALAIRRDHITPIATTVFRSILSTWVDVQLARLLDELKTRAAETMHPSRH
jgi:hypothetical protein